jgi:putative solute:sodium symporter small subunit
VLACVVSEIGTRPIEQRQGGSAALKGFASPRSFHPEHFADRCFEGGMQSMADSASMKQKEEAHWAKTSRLMFTHLGIWFFFGFIIHMFVAPLNKIVIPILGFPLGFYMAAQGSLIVFVVMLFMFAKQQDKIDREYGFAEED